MRRPGSYGRPKYHDPKDRRLVEVIKRSRRWQPDAVNLLGVPFDGAVLGRRGAARGPQAIRDAMLGFSNYSIELGVGIADARVFDLGDVVLDQDDVYAAHREVEKEVQESLSASSLLVVLGGDNSLSLPSLRALSKKFERIGLVVIDSHLDLRGKIGGKPTSGSSYGLAIEAIHGLDPRRVSEIGPHGFLNSQAYANKAARLGIEVHSAREVGEEGALAVAREAYQKASSGADAVYVSLDMDAVDVSQVSGVSAPSAGGVSASAISEMVYYLSGRKKVVCADIVELAPALDPSGRSQVVAATALTYMIAGFVSRSGA